MNVKQVGIALSLALILGGCTKPMTASVIPPAATIVAVEPAMENTVLAGPAPTSAQPAAPLKPSPTAEDAGAAAARVYAPGPVAAPRTPQAVVEAFLASYRSDYLAAELRHEVDVDAAGWEARVLGLQYSIPTDYLLERTEIRLADDRRVAYVVVRWAWGSKSVSKRIFVLSEESNAWRIREVQGGDAFYFEGVGAVPDAAIKAVDLALGMQLGDDRLARAALAPNVGATAAGNMLDWLELDTVPRWVRVTTSSVYGTYAYVDARFVFADGSEVVRRLKAVNDDGDGTYLITAVEPARR